MNNKYDICRDLFFYGYNFLNTNAKEFGKGNHTVVELRDYEKGLADLEYFQNKYPNAKWWLSTKYCTDWLDVREDSNLVANEKDESGFNYIKRKNS